MPEAAQEHKKQFDEIKEKYKSARGEMLDLRSQTEKAKKAALNMNNIDEKITVNQFLNSNPEVEEQLKNIRDKTIWNKAFAKIATERGLYMAGGYIARATAVGLLGVAAAPVAAAGIAAVPGGIFARRRAKEEVVEKAVSARREDFKSSQEKDAKFRKDIVENIGSLKKEIKEDNEKLDNSGENNLTPHENSELQLKLQVNKDKLKKLEKKEQEFFLEHGNYVDASYLNTSFDSLIEELQSNGINDNARSEMKESLKFHIEDAEEKIASGTVNFGSGADRLANQYELIQQISKAKSLIASYDISTDKKYREENKELDKFLVGQDKKIDKSKRKYVNKKTMQGVAIASTFAIAGYGIRMGGEYMGWWEGKGDTVEVPGDSSSSEAEIKQMPQQESVPAQQEQAVDFGAGHMEDTDTSIPDQEENPPKNTQDKNIDETEQVKATGPSPEEMKLNKMTEDLGGILKGKGLDIKNIDQEQLKEVMGELSKRGYMPDDYLPFLEQKSPENKVLINETFLEFKKNQPVASSLPAEKTIEKSIPDSTDSTSNNNQEVIDKEKADPVLPRQEEKADVPQESEDGQKTTIDGGEPAKDEEVMAQQKPEEVLGLKDNFTLKLGEGKVPAQLERVFHMMSVDSMEDVLGADKVFGEEEGAKSLNVAANLVRLAEGHGAPGVDAETFKGAVEWNPQTGELNIKDYGTFNEIVKSLHYHADGLWEKGILQKGAAAHLDDISQDSWKDIIESEGLEKVGEVETGLEGHDSASDTVKNFSDSEMVNKAEELSQVITPKEEVVVLATDQTPEISPEKIKTITAEGIINEFAHLDGDDDDVLNNFLEDINFREIESTDQAEILGELADKALAGDMEARGAWEFLNKEYSILNSDSLGKMKEVQIEILKIKDEFLPKAEKVVNETVKKMYGKNFLFFGDRGYFHKDWPEMGKNLAKNVLRGDFGHELVGAENATEDKLTKYTKKFIDIIGSPGEHENIRDYLLRGEVEQGLKDSQKIKTLLAKVGEIKNSIGYNKIMGQG